jgi:hypothetical protein
MLVGTCHCRAVTITLPSMPETATSCNCSLCRRLGGVWAYYVFGTVQITGNTMEYIQGDKTLRTMRCAICGCTTHWEPGQTLRRESAQCRAEAFGVRTNSAHRRRGHLAVFGLSTT